jgi:hypothetical protein
MYKKSVLAYRTGLQVHAASNQWPFDPFQRDSTFPQRHSLRFG